MEPIAIYIHVPFCVRKCDYCDFLSFPADCAEGSASSAERYLRALKSEIDAADIGDREVRSIYIGGGTPTSLGDWWLTQILDRLFFRFNVAADAEISVEANPGTVDLRDLETLLHAGVNRLSLGVQSFDDRELKLLGRVHDAACAERSFEAARKAGFDNINIDLMAALPGQDKEALLRSVKRTCELKPEHLSLYSLIIEEGTLFYARYSSQVKDPHYDRDLRIDFQSAEDKLPDEDTEREMLHAAWELLAGEGYERYEISNFARGEDFRCVQNLTYWRRGEYLGLGLGAASLIDEKRYSNLRDLAEYMERVNNGSCAADESTVEILADKDRMEETMFLGLRLKDGVSEQEFKDIFHKEIDDIYGDVIRRFVGEGLLDRADDRIKLTMRGTDLANHVISGFML